MMNFNTCMIIVFSNLIMIYNFSNSITVYNKKLLYNSECLCAANLSDQRAKISMSRLVDDAKNSSGAREIVYMYVHIS